MACFIFLVNAARGQGHELPPLQPPHGDLAPTFWEQHGWQVVLAAAFCVLVIGWIIIWLRRPKVFIPEPPAIVARRALESWRGQAQDGALVADVSRVLRRYVMAAFNFPSEELTTTEFRKALQSHSQIAPDIASATGDFLRRCDEWKFAPTPPAPQLGAVAVALELVNKMEASRAPVPVKT
ncbi:MAG TPA: DUF4381 family protein [Verrucomicrobiae bacterium]|nr:DUF4381 family protein [Verrucomicrobiae bacterium]